MTTRSLTLKAPFPYFGGKSAIASIVWRSLQQPDHYLEPFFGSGAVLLAREGYNPLKHTETICDKDGFIANVWRSIQFSPEETAKWCDWPVNHADLMARKRELIKNEGRLLSELINDAKWHDPVMAGYWIWSASCWIGSGMLNMNQRPNLSEGNKGVCALSLKDQVPEIVTNKGINAIGKRPTLSHNSGINVRNKNILSWFQRLSERFRYVRVVCGDWTRICGGNWQDNEGTCGIFFDPPYSDVANRDKHLYHKDSESVAHDVREWCRERGKKSTYRIILAGYREEHESLLSEGWRMELWQAQGGYANQGNNKGKENKKREALFFSPYCPKVQESLF